MGPAASGIEEDGAATTGHFWHHRQIDTLQGDTARRRQALKSQRHCQ